MKNFPILLLLFIGIALTSCEKDPVEPEPKTASIDEIVGIYDGNLVHFAANYIGYYDAENNNAFVATDSTSEENIQFDQLTIEKVGTDSIRVSNFCIADRIFIYNASNEYIVQKVSPGIDRSIILTFDTDNFAVKLESLSSTENILSPTPERQVENCTFEGIKQ